MGDPAGLADGKATSGGSTAFNWLRFKNTVNSLGPLGTCSIGGASPGLNTSVVLDTGRFRNPGSAGGGTRDGAGGPKNGSMIGGEETCDGAGRDNSGEALTAGSCGAFRFGLVPSAVPPSCDPFPTELSAKICVKEPGGSAEFWAGTGMRGSGSLPPGPNTRVKSPCCSLAGVTSASSGTPGEVCGAPGLSNGSRKKRVNSPVVSF